ncbi:MAG TPA: AsmA family protein [Xanthobacteraceae bacterium]|nr:AsmA family protein [Xanthobacteraceae bacterium]
MTAATSFKRLGIAMAVCIGVCIAVLAALPLLIPAEKVRNAVIAEIQAVTGLNTVIHGNVSVSLLPWGTVTFTNVRLEGDRSDPPAFAAERLTAGLRLYPLLFGRIEAADLSLVEPRIALTFDADGKSNWSGLVESLARGLKPGAKRTDRVMSFSEIRMTGGTLSVRDDTHDLHEELSGLELSLAWPSISNSFATIGRVNWRGEQIDASITLSDLFQALVGGRSGLKVRLNGAPFKVAFDGHLSYRPTLKIEGMLAADSASLRQTLVWAGQKPLPGSGFGRFTLKAQTNVSGTTVALSSVNVELDGNSAEGVLSLTNDTHFAVQGTLAAEDINFTPYISAIHLLRNTERDWSAVPIALDGLNGFDIDLRLSAARVSVGGAKVGRTAVAANLRNGRLNVTIGESQAFNGLLKGSVILAGSENGAEIKSQLHFVGVDLENCLGELFGIHRLEGNGTVNFAIDSSGDSILALAKKLNGTILVTARDGALTGVNVEQLLRRLERRPLSGGGEFRSGRTPFNTLNIDIKVAQGIATVQDVRMESTAVRLGLVGTASVPARDLDLKGTAGLVQTASATAPAFELPFIVQGQWDDPIMLPDPESLIRRSGAAAPLLNAVKDNKTRDAVRSVIEQLTRGGAPTASAGPAARAEPVPSTR